MDKGRQEGKENRGAGETMNILAVVDEDWEG